MTLDKLLERIYDLPSIPKVVQDLIENFNSNSANADEISRNIQSDPVIAAKVLRLANSVRYGAGRKVSSLDSAVVLLGVDTLKTLVIASGITGSFKAIPGLDAKEFWRSSFMVANICKLVAKNAQQLDAETAFTCGMLHNIGIALMHLTEPDKMIAIADQVSQGANRFDLERGQFGFDNNLVGAQLAKAWKFPANIVSALEHQGNPLESDSFSHYAAVIKLSVFLNRGLEQGMERDTLISELPEALTAPLHLDRHHLSAQLATALEAEDDIDELLAA